MRIKALVAGIAAVLTSTAAPAAELRSGVVWHSLSADLWQGDIADREAAPALSLEIAFGEVSPPGDIAWRPFLGARISTKGGALAYGGIAAEMAVGDWLYRLGLGAAIHDGPLRWDEPEAWRDGRRPLGSRVLFYVPGEVGRQIGGCRVSIFFDHVSNGFTGSPNPGIDAFGVRIAFPL